jgi:hypothetical protein
LGLLVSIQKKFSDRAAKGLNPQPSAGPNGVQPWPPLSPSMVARGSIGPRQPQPHGLARPAAALRQQAPMLHRMTALPAASAIGGGATQQAHSQASQAAPSQVTASQATSSQVATRTQNPYQYTSAHYTTSGSNIPQQQIQQYQTQPGFLQQQQQQQFNGQPPQGYIFGDSGATAIRFSKPVAELVPKQRGTTSGQVPHHDVANAAAGGRGSLYLGG